MAMTDLEKAQAKIIEMNGLIGANAKDDRYYDALAGLDEDQRKAQFRDYEGEGGALARQLEQAEALKGTAAPQGQQVGGQFMAANPFEHLGSFANKAVGHYKGNKAEGELEQLGKDKWGTNKDLAMANIDFVRKQRAEAEALKALQ